MAEALVAAAAFILAVTGIGLFRVLRSGIAAERMMAVQLVGTASAAALLLLGTATGEPAAADIALLLVLFAAFACIAFARGEREPEGRPDLTENRP